MNIQLNFQSYPIRVYAMVDACIALPLLSVIQLKLVIIDINYITILINSRRDLRWKIS